MFLAIENVGLSNFMIIYAHLCLKHTHFHHILAVSRDTGYPYDGRANKDSYLHDGRANKESYQHDRHNQYIMLSL